MERWEHADIGILEKADDWSEWTRTIDREFMPDWNVRYQYLGGEFGECEIPYDRCCLNVRTEDRQKPSEAQIEAWRYFKTNANNVYDVAKRGLHKIINSLVLTEVAELSRNLSELYLEDFRAEVETRGALTLAGVQDQARLSIVSIYGIEHDNIAFLSLKFDWSWDEENKIELLFHKNQCLTYTGHSFWNVDLLQFLPGMPNSWWSEKTNDFVADEV